ncbi:MAG TPA: hypothetical protein VFH56_04845 [Acidimicrobiales bacterium]|nr:hypothetical protein [Acidimicrobiales bacterium]
MNYLDLVKHLPWGIVIAALCANAIPYLSALATKAPSWATGAITAVLSLADGFLAELPAKHYDVRAALGTAFAAWLVAAIHHTKILAGTVVEQRLYAAGSKPLKKPAAPAA